MLKTKILVVEDEALVADDIRRTLQNLGYYVTATASSGEEAIKKVEEINPDLVLMDIVLQGGVDGIETAKQIVSLFKIPIIYLTAYSDKTTLERAKITEPFGYIIKPFREKELKIAIEIALFKQDAENKLKESKEWLSTTLRSINDAVIATDSKGCVKFMNPIAQYLTGLEIKEAQGMPLRNIVNIISEKADEFSVDFTANASGEGTIKSHQTVLFSKNKKKIPIEIRSAPIKDDRGSITGTVMVFRDITERLRAEKALKQSEIKYRTLIENIQDGVFIIQDDKIQFANESFARIGGYTVEEVTGKNFHEFVAPEDLEMFTDRYRRRQAGEKVPKEYEFRMLRKDGGKIIVNMTVGLITYNARVASVGTVKDITERKLSEEALQESEDRYRRLVNFSPFGIAIHSDHKIVYANLAAMKILGAKNLENLIGRPMLQIIHPDYHEIAKERIRKQEQGYVAPQIEEKFVRLDGTFVDVEIVSIPFAYKGKLAMYGVFQDITERKLAEGQIKASLKEKEMLLREIHHRVKNNMQLISSLLRLQSGYANEEIFHNVFKDCQNRIISMSLIHEKLYRSKELTKIDLNDYIRDLVSRLFQSYNACESTIALNIDVENVSLGIDLATPCGLIINELVNNSLKHAFPYGREGEIKVALKQTDENTFELLVSDNGVGIPEDLDFRKTESLGLRLVTILVEDQLEGEISLDRSKGTEFQIKFKREN